MGVYTAFIFAALLEFTIVNYFWRKNYRNSLGYTNSPRFMPMPSTSESWMELVPALDIWMGVYTAFIIAALLEFTIVNYFWRKNFRNSLGYTNSPRFMPMPSTSESWIELVPKHLNGQDIGQYSPPGPLQPPIVETPTSIADLTLTHTAACQYRLLACSIDKLSRYIFPAVFMVFNIIYWSYYLSNRHINNDKTGPDIKTTVE